MAAVAYIPLSAVASARLATTQASSSNAASQPSAGIVAFKRAVTPSCLVLNPSPGGLFVVRIVPRGRLTTSILMSQLQDLKY
uniref:Uncharacterized protein n=1 Tax=Physcomitrium patens TaxID=3218 RepID=A0A7I3Z4N4_PHYPA